MTKFSSCLSSLVFGRTRAGGSFLFQESLISAGSVAKKDFWIARRNRPDNIRERITKTITNKSTENEYKSGVERRVNFQAVDDWIVALLPGGLEALPVAGDLMNLGGAGAYGFQGLGDHEQQRISGDHGAAICPAMWDILADLVLDRTKKPPIQAPTRTPIEHAAVPGSVAQGLTNQLWGYLRPLGGLAIIVAMLISFSPWLIVVWKLKAPQLNALSAMAGLLLVLGCVSCLAQILAPSMKVLRQGRGAREAPTSDRRTAAHRLVRDGAERALSEDRAAVPDLFAPRLQSAQKDLNASRWPQPLTPDSPALRTSPSPGRALLPSLSPARLP